MRLLGDVVSVLAFMATSNPPIRFQPATSGTEKRFQPA